MYKNTIALEPSFIHVWAQTDRYALALGFINNNFDFFHPQTYTLDLQFPAAHDLTIKEGITRVDFPIHEYIIALLMKITECKSPLIFRLYILIYSWIGLVFLALFVEKLSGSRIKGWFVMLFAFTAPVFTYYQSGFLPTIPSIADALIALYFYQLYKTDQKPGHLYWSLVFFTLSALSRTPFTILIIAFFCQQVLSWMLVRKVNKREFIVFVISFGIIGAYFLYNVYLGYRYGSIFLSHPLPAQSWDEFKSLLDYSWTRWRFDYFTQYHYAAFLILLVLLIVTSFKKIFQHKHILMFIIIFFIGEALYCILMIKQFPDHDYYFLDTFYLLFILLLVIVISGITINGYWKTVLSLFLFISIIAFSIKTQKIQLGRYTVLEDDLSEATRRNFEGSDRFLDSVGVSQNAKILVLGAFSYNIPFVKMGRKGIAIVSPSHEDVEEALNEKFDFIIIQDPILLSRIISAYPDIVTKIDRIAGNGRITLYKTDNKPYETVENFIGLKPDNKLYEYAIDHEKNYDTIHWSNFHKSEKVVFKGKYSGESTTKDEFEITFADSLDDLNKGNKVYITLETAVENIPDNDVFLIASIENSKGVPFYKAEKIRFLTQKNQWKKQYSSFRLPKVINKGDLLKIYLWNPDKEKFYYDDVTIALYNES